MWDSKLTTEAIFFANRSHGDQTMVHPENMPYSAHYYGVALTAINFAQLVKNVDYDLLICSALLHDTLEDTSASHAEIAEIFGKGIADGVLALTKNKYIERQDQMHDSLNRILMQPKEIAIVKMADRYFNLRDNVPAWSQEKHDAYKQEAQMICDMLGKNLPEIQKILQEQIDNY